MSAEDASDSLGVTSVQYSSSFALNLQELVTKKMQLAMSEEAMLNMVDKYEKHFNGKAQSRLSSLWRTGS